MRFRIGNFEFGTTNEKGSGTVPLSHGQIRDQWNDPTLKSFDTYLPTKYNLPLYDVIRESIPLIDVAIIKLVRLIGDFDFETFGNDSLRRKLEAFREKVKINYYQTGLDDYIYQVSDAAFAYGFSVGELVPNSIITNVERLKIGDSKTFKFKKDGNRLVLVQAVSGGFQEVPMRDNIFLLSFDNRNGHPQGVSLIASLPWVAQVLLRIEKSLENLYWRMGDPTFVSLVSGGDKSNYKQVKEAIDGLIEQFNAAFQARRQGKTMDIHGGAPNGGKVDIKSLGADFNWPDVDKHTRLLIEQIISKTNLPPFSFGLNWSTTERMSKDQNDMLIMDTNARRRQLEPHIIEIIDSFLILTGDAGARWKLRWKPVNMLDVMENSRARYFEAFAMEKEIDNYLALISNGWATEEEINERVRSDFRYRKEMHQHFGGHSKKDAQKYLALKKKQYAKRTTLNSIVFQELLKDEGIEFGRR